MDRISLTEHATPTASPAVLREVKPMALPTARLRLADRADTVELSGAAVTSGAPSLERLIAARVSEPVRPAAAMPATSVASRAMRFYADPSDQNAAATLGAGSALDVLA